MMPSVMQTLDSDKQLIITVTNKANSKNVIEKKKIDNKQHKENLLFPFYLLQEFEWVTELASLT